MLKHTIFELNPSSEEKIFPILLSSACNCNWTKVMSLSRTQVCNSLIMTLDIERKPTVIAQIWAFRNCLRQLYFKSKWRGIGYSFQLAITAPLYSITGYCIATAQSWGGTSKSKDCTQSRGQLWTKQIPSEFSTCFIWTLQIFLQNELNHGILTWRGG